MPLSIPRICLPPSVRVLLQALLALVAAVLTVAWSPAWADDAQARKPASPYFHVASDDPSLDRLPLKSTQVDARIAGVIAEVTVTQRYRNEGGRKIDARYVFPGSTQAAVHAMNVRIGERQLSARIEEKHAARAEFETARRDGKTGALLEQQRPNVFEMNVANILPGDEVAVELRYTELLQPTDARYQWVFPTVVGPRYDSPASPSAGERWVAAPFLPAGQAAPAAFDLQVELRSPIGVKELRSPTHAIDVSGLDTREAHAGLAAAAGRPAADRDFILDYRLAGDRLESGVTLFRGESENFLLAMIEPPAAVPVQQINPRDYIFVVDISGSMHGFPLDTARTLLENLIGGLRASDTFNLMLFAGSSRMLAPQSVPATRANIDEALRLLHDSRGGGSTEIVPALKRIAALPKPDAVARSVIVVTDGYVTVENEVFQIVRRELGRANVFAFGIGSSVNRHLIEGIARAGQGEAFVVTRPDQAAAQAERLRRIVEAPVLTRVQARFEGLDVYDVQPAPLPDVLGGRPVVMIGKWRAPAAGAAQGRLVVEGRKADGPYREVVALDTRGDAQASALRQLWARQRIATLADEEALAGGSAQRDGITALGLKYGLLTAYTSFVAVDQRIRDTGPSTAVDQPSPLPEGVSNLAIGAEVVPSTPEPAAGLALAVGLAALLVAARRRRSF